MAGRRLGDHLAAAGFGGVRTDARYERYLRAERIAGYLAAQLDDAGEDQHAATVRSWANGPTAMFAQSWVSATAVRTPGPRSRSRGHGAVACEVISSVR